MSAWGVAVTALALVLAAVVTGQAVARAAGVREWSWAAPAAGLGLLIVVTLAAVALPGAGTTGAVALVVVTLAAAVFARRSFTRAAVAETALVAIGALAIAALPFAAAGHVGILGATDNGDLAGHIQLAESVRSGDPPVGLDPDWHTNYPTGSHALVASVATLTGTELDAAFTGLIAALLALGALTALAALRDLSRVRRVAGALLAGIPFLVAAYAVQASHKETLIGVLTLGFGLLLPAATSARRALPLAVIGAGALAAYSFVGLEWPAVVALAWVALRLVRERRLPSRAALRRAARPALAVAALLALVLVPQLDQASALVGAVVDVAQGSTTGGNVRAELPFYEVFGLWPAADPRTFGASATVSRLLAAVGAAAFAYGAWWCWRRRRLELLALAAGCLAVYAQARLLATPYYSGKALSIAAPPVMLVIAVALLRARGHAALVVLGVLAVAAWSSVLVLHGAAVAPPGHAAELQSLRPLLAGKPVFYFGRNDFIQHHLRGARVSFPYVYLGRSQIGYTTRPQKGWQVTHAFDWDGLDAPSLDRFRYVVAPRTGYASEPPENWRRIRTLPSYEVFERRGPTVPRETLDEPNAPGALADCATPAGDAAARGGGEAAVLARPIVVEPVGRLVDLEPTKFAVIDPGGSMTLRVRLPAGRWQASLQYVSPKPVTLTAGGRTLRGRASMEGAGAFWLLGELEGTGGVEELAIRPERGNRDALVGRLALTRPGRRRVPSADVCGRYVDWYRPGSSNQPG